MSKEGREAGEYCIMRSFIFCTPRQISTSMRWVGHVADTGARKNTCGFLQHNFKERNYFEDMFVDEQIILT
jgi:hypothetical protein